MTLLPVYALVLLLAAVGLAHRTVLSTAVLFLTAGFVLATTSPAWWTRPE